MELKIVRKKSSIYKDKKGVERQGYNYYISCNGNFIAIKPSFNQGYLVLNSLAEDID